jgi:hypothetical protein
MFRQSVAAASGAAGLPPVGLLDPLPGVKRHGRTATAYALRSRI